MAFAHPHRRACLHGARLSLVGDRGGGRPWLLSFRQSHLCRGCVTLSCNHGLMVSIEAVNRIGGISFHVNLAIKKSVICDLFLSARIVCKLKV